MYQIVVDTPHYLVIDKFPNVNFHCEDGVPGVVEQLKRDLMLDALYPVHRLDHMTSGLLLFARDPETAELLNQQFRQRTVEKF